MTRILFVWSGLTGYMGDCWRALAADPDVALKVAVDTDERWYGGSFKADDVLRDLNWARELPTDWRPDVIFTVGWHNPLCRSAALKPEWQSVPKVCCFDMPWRWSLRCLAARFVLGPYLRRFSAAFIPGRSADRYARWLGFPKIYHGLFSTNTRRFGIHRGGRGFLFVGRDVPEKGTNVLRRAHARYVAAGGRLPLNIVTGVSPDQLGEAYADADCFVLPSRWDPWGVVLVEAAAAGLPIICTDRCGARHEVVCEGSNGLVVPAGSVTALATAMMKFDKLNGEDGRARAQNYSCEAWAERVVRLAKELV